MSKKTPKAASPAAHQPPATPNPWSPPYRVADEVFRETLLRRPPRGMPAFNALADDFGRLVYAVMSGDTETALRAATALSNLESRVKDAQPVIAAIRRMAGEARVQAAKAAVREA